MGNLFTQEYPKKILPIYEESKKFFNKEIKKGVSISNTKAFSGSSLEECARHTILNIIDDLKTKYSDIDLGLEPKNHYIKSDFIGHSDERLDQHVYLNGKYVYLEENRAWVDKPFYTLKRGVIRNIMLSCPSKLSKNIKFGMLSYCLDIKQEIINTCDYTQGYGDRLECFSLTGRSRNTKVNGKEVNWYETGFLDSTIKSYVSYIYNTLEGAINETSDSVPRRLSA
jgi:hypothetical protein